MIKYNDFLVLSYFSIVFDCCKEPKLVRTLCKKIAKFTLTQQTSSFTDSQSRLRHNSTQVGTNKVMECEALVEQVTNFGNSFSTETEPVMLSKLVMTHVYLN